MGPYGLRMDPGCKEFAVFRCVEKVPVDPRVRLEIFILCQDLQAFFNRVDKGILLGKEGLGKPVVVAGIKMSG